MSKSKLENMQYQLCGCIKGYFLCPEAVRLWGLYSLEYNYGNYKKAEYYRKQYENHFENKQRRELEALLNNCVDDDEAILYQRELERLEEVKTSGS